MIVRTAVMDEIILRAIARDGVQAVVNLAAGLDARPFRLELPRTLRWIDVDLPAMQDYNGRPWRPRRRAARSSGSPLIWPRRPSAGRLWRASPPVPDRRSSSPRGCWFTSSRTR